MFLRNEPGLVSIKKKKLKKSQMKEAVLNLISLNNMKAADQKKGLLTTEQRHRHLLMKQNQRRRK